MASEKRKCYTCGSEYEYCTRCSKYASQPKWRWMWDTEECKDLYDVVSGYKMGVNTEADIKEVLNKHNITDYSKYTKSITDLLNSLFGNNFYKKPKKKFKKEMDIDLKENETVVEEVIAEVPIIEEPVIIDDSTRVISEINGISDLI